MSVFIYIQLYETLVIEKWQSDTSRLIITMGIHQKEQLKYLENIHYTVNTASITSISNDINKDKNKEEDIIYSKFPITSLETLNELDNEVKQLKLLKVDVYDALVSFKFMWYYSHSYCHHQIYNR